ncbi:MAG TPA: hypothetical protein VHY37_10730, partial [Tepidisphaeraceae bacterium]|nr:hypothetical protein [Tepidisphaeraceae bacterium]
MKGSSVNTVTAPPSVKPSVDWKPLTLLHHQFTANVDALAPRDGKLAERLRGFAPIHQLLVNTTGNAVMLGRRIGEEIEVIPELVSPSVAAEAVKQLCPAGALTLPTLIAGIDRGWLWQRLYAAPSAASGVPGHRLPLFFLEKQIDRLWTALHLHDWRSMLADPRVRLFAGEDTYGQFRQSLLDQPMIPWPRQSITVDQTIWPHAGSLDRTLAETTLAASQIIERNRRDMAAYYAGQTPAAIAEQLRSGKPMRILGITSRYTTFLQYSMRDWLAAFERTGHTTQLLIESLDHEHLGPIRPGQACAEFRPDLILIIDHYRREFPSLPIEVPCVMWVQDQMQHLFSPAGGAAQDILDYCLGFARLRMTSEFQYPANRYMPAHVGVDETRYHPRELSADQQQRFGCDVSFVSHASMPAKTIVEQESARHQSPEARKILYDIFDRLSAIYAAGGIVSEEPVISAMIDQGLADHKLAITPETKGSLLHFFHQRVNNALFRHQPLEWLAEMGVDLRLWGRGWESHPTLSRFARGPADNQTQLAAIYQASRINLHVSPHGAVHQRIFEGLAAGGFFLLRHCPGDELERHFRKIIGWCEASGVISDPELLRCATRDIRKELSAIAKSLQ